MCKEEKCIAHLKIKSKYFKYALSVLQNQDVPYILLAVWNSGAPDNFVFFMETKMKLEDGCVTEVIGPVADVNLSPFSRGDDLETLCIFSKSGVSFVLPVMVWKWALGYDMIKIPISVVEKLIKVLPDDDILIDIYVYEKNDEVGFYVILKHNEFAVMVSEK